jgi:hypothetical protein
MFGRGRDDGGKAVLIRCGAMGSSYTTKRSELSSEVWSRLKNFGIIMDEKCIVVV